MHITGRLTKCALPFVALLAAGLSQAPTGSDEAAF